MRQKTAIIPLQQMMHDFLTAAKGSKAIPNVFTKVPKFSSEKDMYTYITETLNNSGQFSGKTFATTGYKPDPLDPSRQTIDAGMYDSKDAPPMEYTASGTEESRRCLWALVQLLIECKLDSVSQDPFDESADNNEATAEKRREVLGQILAYVELAFKYQQREFVWMVLFLGRSARIIRFDRSGIIASEKFDYSKRGAELTEFLVRWAHLGPANRGHDSTAIRILSSDSLASQLKQHGAEAAKSDPEDHVQKLFNQSLDPQWPWWKLSVPDEESKTQRWFAVGKPHFYAGGVAGRGTRGYVAAPLTNDGKAIDPLVKFVYLKDAWRVDHEGMGKEGTILKALNDAKVPHVPTLLYHGDLGQSAKSYDLWPDYHEGKTRAGCPLKSHQHYRLVVAEVGKPLSEFANGHQLVWALYCCISAHEQACAAGYIHRDISAGNILLYRDETGEWVGLLNDWELSKKWADGKTEDGGRQLDRTGTWQFMSVHVLVDSTKLVETPDDLESFFHVLIHFAVRFLPHNLPDDAVGRFLYNYFDDYTDGLSGFTCGQGKYNAIKRGVIDLTPITGNAGGNGNQKEQPLVFVLPPSAAPSDSKGTTEVKDGKIVATRASHPINALITELLKAFEAFYAKDAVQAPGMVALADPIGLSPAVLAAYKRMQEAKARRTATSGVQLPPAKDDSAVADSQLAQKVETHAAIMELIMGHLYSSMWPKGDKGNDKKPPGGYIPAKENTAIGSTIQTGSKRAAEDGEESMSRRVRSRSRV